MAFGVYIHIPYCLQRCTYCDFATYIQSQILPPHEYVELVCKEISLKSHLFADKTLSTVYFGGGTPSLIPAELIVTLLNHLTTTGFHFSTNCEITLEINPATIDSKKMDLYLSAGINRFSVGAQTFKDSLLRSVHREHSSEQTRQTIELLKSFGVNYSMDLLFALPQQSLDDLKADLDHFLSLSPHHISPYCLTVPEGHSLFSIRPPEETQLDMFQLIKTSLANAGYDRYEISNFSKPGFASKHNLLYWNDENYWGIGLSAHSYIKKTSSYPWGLRFWNPSGIDQYKNYVLQLTDSQAQALESGLEEKNFEPLKFHQSLTDFCHTSLRKMSGLVKRDFCQKYSAKTLQQISGVLAQLVEEGLLKYNTDNEVWSLSEQGILLSNQVFGRLTFLDGELAAP